MTIGAGSGAVIGASSGRIGILENRLKIGAGTMIDVALVKKLRAMRAWAIVVAMIAFASIIFTLSAL